MPGDPRGGASAGQYLVAVIELIPRPFTPTVIVSGEADTDDVVDTRLVEQLIAAHCPDLEADVVSAGTASARPRRRASSHSTSRWSARTPPRPTDARGDRAPGPWPEETRKPAQRREAGVGDIQLSSLRQRLLLNRGAANGVFRGQAVLDDKGLIGQTTHVGPWSADVIMITDPEHGVPVRIERTGLRTIAVGAGDTTSLALPYLPANADVKAGDLLVTSGLGGVFPEGFPVARVTEVHRDAVQPLAQVRAAPLAHVDTDTEVMLVWFRADYLVTLPPPSTPRANFPAAARRCSRRRRLPSRPHRRPARKTATATHHRSSRRPGKRAAGRLRGERAGGAASEGQARETRCTCAQAGNSAMSVDLLWRLCSRRWWHSSSR